MPNRTEIFLDKAESEILSFDFSALLSAGEAYIASTYAALLNQALTYTAIKPGTAGNAVTITLVDPGTLQASTTFSDSGNAITITLRHDGAAITATATNLVSDFASAPSSVKALLNITGSGASVLMAVSSTALSGGVDNLTITCYEVSGTTVIDKTGTTLPTLPVNIISNKVETRFAGGDSTRTYSVEVLVNTDKGRVLKAVQYVSIY